MPRRHLYGLTLLASLAACGPGGGAGKPDAAPVAPGFDKKALLAASADCAIAQYREFEQASAALEAAARAHAATPQSAETRAALQAAWSAASAAWQVAEQYQFGPAAASSEPGGQDLRDQIYSWPLVSRCKVDEQTVSKLYAEPGFATSLINGRGLAAVEYLAFHAGGDNGCGSFSAINADGTWAALAPAELAQRKADYAVAAAADVHARAAALVTAWDGGGFRAKLVEAGAGSPLFASAQAGLNSVSNALFYLDKYVKDAKLARPLGLMDCEEASCPEAVESAWAKDSLARVEANLVGFERLLLGCGGGPGFDDWLLAAGANDLVGRLIAAVAGAHTAVGAVGPSLETALAEDPDKLVALHASLKAITDLLKSELVSVLDLELPKSVESDND
jgi:predicted lipoprotein